MRDLHNLTNISHTTKTYFYILTSSTLKFFACFVVLMCCSNKGDVFSFECPTCLSSARRCSCYLVFHFLEFSLNEGKGKKRQSKMKDSGMEPLCGRASKKCTNILAGVQGPRRLETFKWKNGNGRMEKQMKVKQMEEEDSSAAGSTEETSTMVGLNRWPDTQNANDSKGRMREIQQIGW